MSFTNALNSRLAVSPGGIALPGAVYGSGFVGNAGSGNVDVYTAPTGRRALVMARTFRNEAGSATTIYAQLKSGGVYYRLETNVSVSAGNHDHEVEFPSIILEPGESIAVNTTQAGMNVWFKIVEFDARIPVYSAKLLALPNASPLYNTVYTVPTGFSALVLDDALDPNLFTGALLIVNTSGAARTYTWYVVPSGGSPASTNRISASGFSVSNNTRLVTDAALTLAAGTTIQLQTSATTATQIAWVNVSEMEV